LSRKLRRLLLAGAGALVALVVLACALGGAALWVRHQVQGRLYRHAAELPARDVAIVLGASVYRSGRPSPVVESRLAAALELLRAGKIHRILVSGDHRPEVYDEAEAMGRWLLRAGVAPQDLALDRAGIDAVGFEVGAGLAETGWRDLVRESFATVRALVDVHLPARR